jgi:hypothetical protein
VKSWHCATAVLVFAITGCGYHVAGHASVVPKTIQTICIPAFGNGTTHYKLTDRLPEAISREFIARTRYRIVTDPNACDATLRGAVLNFIAGATVFDPVSQRATAVDIHVYLQLSLVERATGKVLYTRPSMDARERYEVSVNDQQYFEESDPALDRVAKTVAQQVVSSIISSF